MPRFVTVPARKHLPAITLHVCIASPSNVHADAIDPAYPTVVFLPSIWTESFLFYPQGDDPELRREYNMIAIDARAHGQSSVETKFGGTFDWRDVGNDTLAVLDALGVETYHLVGLSHSSIAACHIAQQHPGRALSLCLMHRPVKREIAVLQTVWPQMQKTFSTAVETRDPDLLDQITMCVYEFCVGSFSCPPTDAARDETMQIWRLKLASGELEAAADYILGLTFSRLDIQTAEEMVDVTCPILLLRGTEDGCDPHYEDLEFIDQLNRLTGTSRASLRVIDMVPRWMSLTSPNIVNPLLSAHFKGQVPAEEAHLSPSLTSISSLPSPTWPGTPPTSSALSPGIKMRSLSRRPSTPRDVGASFTIPPLLCLPLGVKSAGEVYDEHEELVVRIETEVLVVVDAETA